VKIELDENLGRACAAQLREAGHDVATVADQGLASAWDEKVIEACRVESRCLVTLDLGFANPLVFDPARHAGIVVVRVAPRSSAKAIAERTRTLIAGLSRSGVDARHWIVEAARIREYRPDRPD
jgi:predicted nuclease of predicted toxin-antitoxin system